MASTDDILDAWYELEAALKKRFPNEEDSAAQINQLKDVLPKADIDIAHRLRLQRNHMIHGNGKIHGRIPIKDPDQFVSETNRIAGLIDRKVPSDSEVVGMILFFGLIIVGLLFLFAKIVADHR